MDQPGVTDALSRRQRTIQITLLIIILTTLPCYCVGLVLLALAPRNTTVAGPTEPPTNILTASAITATAVTFTPIITSIPIPTELGPINPTPVQIGFPTAVPTLTRIPPTFIPPTPIVLPSQTFIIITATHALIPSATPPPVIFTATPLPPTRTVPPTIPKFPPTPTMPKFPSATPLSPTPTTTATPTLTTTFSPFGR